MLYVYLIWTPDGFIEVEIWNNFSITYNLINKLIKLKTNTKHIVLTGGNICQLVNGNIKLDIKLLVF